MTRIVFMGTPRFGELVLSALVDAYEIAAVVCQPDREAGRGRLVRTSAVKAFALRHGLRVLQPPTLRRPEALQELADLGADMILVAAYGKILPAPLLTLPKYQCLNVHASLLPKYRGAAPIPAAILAGDAQTGVSILVIAEEVDSGPILGQARLDIADDDTTASLTEKLGLLGGRFLANDILPRWLAGAVTPVPQGAPPTPYAGMLRREDGCIVWSESAQMLARRCRAFYPWPGAFSHWGDKELKILRAHPHKAQRSEPPGTVVQLGTGVSVVTGDGVLVLEEVQLAGKRPLAADEFLRGQRTFLGSLLH